MSSVFPELEFEPWEPLSVNQKFAYDSSAQEMTEEFHLKYFFGDGMYAMMLTDLIHVWSCQSKQYEIDQIHTNFYPLSILNVIAFQTNATTAMV